MWIHDFLTSLTICCMLVSHQGIPLKFMQEGVHYYYTPVTLFVNCKKKVGSWTFEATLFVKEAQNMEGKHSGVLGKQTSFSWFAILTN